MASSRYEQVPIEMSLRGRHGESGGDDVPLINPARPELPDSPARLSMSSKSPSQTSERAGHVELNHERTNSSKGKLQAHIQDFWGSFRDLLEDKPYELKASWGSILWNLFKRLITVLILVSAIVFGAAGASFSIADRTIWHTFQVNQDVQLAAFGILNTILAHMVRDSLVHISDTLVTRWMVAENGDGATMVDFDMKEELSKPWAAISSFRMRRKRKGQTFRNISRLIITFGTGACLLLQGASINTIGMPKLRWWPDTRFVTPEPGDERFFFHNKTMHVASVSRMSVWDRSWNMIREGGDISWELAHMFAAISSLESLENVYTTMTQSVGWYKLADDSRLIHSVLNVTNTSTPSIQTASINGKATAEMWDEQRKTGDPWARKAMGWFASLKLTGLLLDTGCTEIPGHEIGEWKASSRTNSTIVMTIGPVNESKDGFLGATCTISVHQILFEIKQWILEGHEFNSDRPDWDITNLIDPKPLPFPPITRLPGTAADSAIARELADWFNALSPNLQNLCSASETTNLTAIAMQLSAAIVQLNRGHNTMGGLAIVISTILSNSLSSFSWQFKEIDGMITTQGPVRWEVYGSGPRLSWQWAIAAVLGVNILVQFFDLWLLTKRQAKGLWLTLGGMLVAANSAVRMASVSDDQGAGFVSERGHLMRYFVRQSAAEEGQDARATLVSEMELKESAKYTVLEVGKSYGVEKR